MAKPRRETTRSTSGRLDNLFSWRRAILEATPEEMPATRAHVLLTLSCHMNDVGDGCWPSQATLAAETKLSLRAVQAHLQGADETGWLMRSLVFRNGEVAGTNYRTAIPAVVWTRMLAAAAAPIVEDDVEAPDEQPAFDLGVGGVAGDATPPAGADQAGGVAPPATPPAPGATRVAGGAGRCRTSCREVSQEVHPNSSKNSSVNASKKETEPAAPGARSPDPAGGLVEEPKPNGQVSPMPPGRPTLVTQAQLDEQRTIVNLTLEYSGSAELRATDVTRWEKLWQKHHGDLGELVLVCREAKRRCATAGHGVSLQYLVDKWDTVAPAAHQAVPVGAVGNTGGNAAFLARLTAGGGS